MIFGVSIPGDSGSRCWLGDFMTWRVVILEIVEYCRAYTLRGNCYRPTVYEARRYSQHWLIRFDRVAGSVDSIKKCMSTVSSIN